MKKCPFCKADIEDNARFCLYCMKPLNEKEVIPPPQKKPQWWPLVLAAVLLTALVAVVVLMPRGNRNLPTASTSEASSSTGQTTEQVVETTDNSTQDTQGNHLPQTDATTEEPNANQKPTQNQNSNTQNTAENITPTTKPATPTTPTTTPTTPTTEQPATTLPAETTEETAEPEETTAPEQPQAEVVYTYRTARAGDDFSAQYQNAGNDIVITGISKQSANGVYDIPAYIDGKKVIAIVANAFSGSNAKTVYVPTTVKNIWNYAFAGCGLTDIYFRGNSLYAEGSAFPTGITIHCSASCSDRNFRYYKNSAVNYDATWAEWNG